MTEMEQRHSGSGETNVAPAASDFHPGGPLSSVLHHSCEGLEGGTGIGQLSNEISGHSLFPAGPSRGCRLGTDEIKWPWLA